MRGLTLYSVTTKANKDHGECATCGEPIIKGQQIVTLREFDVATKRGGRTWKRHAGCPRVDVEQARLSDARRPSK
jgi:hypothetical protein